MLKLSNPYILELRGDPDSYVKSPHDRKNLYYLLDRLFSGQKIEEKEMESYGLKIRVVDEFVRIPRAE